MQTFYFLGKKKNSPKKNWANTQTSSTAAAAGRV